MPGAGTQLAISPSARIAEQEQEQEQANEPENREETAGVKQAQRLVVVPAELDWRQEVVVDRAEMAGCWACEERQVKWKIAEGQKGRQEVVGAH